MKSNFVLKLTNEILPQLPNFVTGVAVAGSHSRNEQTPYSDLDLFIVFSDSDGNEYRARIEEVVKHFPTPLLRRGPVFVPHFGDSVTLVRPEIGIIQINFNTLRTLELNPMRRNSRIILDRDGEYQRLVDAAKRSSISESELYVEYSDWFWIRCMFAHAAIAKGELHKASGYLHEARTAIMQIVRIVENAFDEARNPFLPASRFERDLGQDVAHQIGAMFPSYSEESLLTSLRDTVEYFWELQSSAVERHPYCLAPLQELRDQLTGGVS